MTEKVEQAVDLNTKNMCNVNIAVEAVTTPTSQTYDIAKFRLTKILQNNTTRKSITLLGTFPDNSAEEQAIILFEKQAFRESDVQTKNEKDDEMKKDTTTPNESDGEGAETVETGTTSFFNADLSVKTEFINNIYGSYLCQPSAKLNDVKTTVVYPATAKHIEKYSVCKKYLINETPALYDNFTLPYINSHQFSLEWVYNILEHKQEEERIVYEDTDPETGFVLLPDLKWDGKNENTLYLLAITHKRNIKSLRDLKEEHLPLLRNIRRACANVISDRYGVEANQLRMYLHYQPSFYHLHVHINLLRNDAPGIWCEKSHMLDTVIDNINLMPHYYQSASLPFVLYDGNELWSAYKASLLANESSKNILQAVDDVVQKKESNENAEEEEVLCKRIKYTEDKDQKPM